MRQQDGAWSWIILFTATLSDALSCSMTYCYSIILPVLVKEFNESREKAAWISSISYSLFYLAAPFTAMIVIRLGNRWTAVFGCIMCIVSLVASSYATSLELLYLTHGLLFGLGTSLVHFSGILSVRNAFKKRRSMATGIFSTASSFSALLGPIFKIFIDKIGWRYTFSAVGLCFLVPFTLVSILYANADKNDSKRRNSDQTTTKRRLSCSYWNPWFTIGVIVVALQSFVIYMPLSHLVKYANEVNYPDKKSSMLLVYIGVTSLLSKIITGRILDCPKVCVFWVNQFAGLALSLSILLLKLATDDVGFISFAVLYGVGNGSFVMSQYELWTAFVSPIHRTMALATGEAIAAIGILTGSPFTGFLADVTGWYGTSFLVSSSISLAASLLLFLRFCFKKNTWSANDEE